jgi:hypothetical protein
MLTKQFKYARRQMSSIRTLRKSLTTPATGALLVALWASTAQSQPCCASVQPPCVGYWAASAVFVGRVEAIQRVGTSRVVSFAVLEGFAGVRASTIEVSTGTPGQRCSLSLAIGKEYIVYADRSEDGGLTASRCSGTRAVEDAGSDLAYAREVKQGRVPAGYLAGRVLTAARDLAGKTTGVPQPAEGISVTVTRDGLTDILTTDRAGDFRSASHGPGAYRISVSVPEPFYSDKASTTVPLRDPRACAVVAFTLHDNGQVAGRVVDAAGRPVAGLTIELGPSGPGPGRRAVTDRAGRYFVAQMPAGRFVLSVPAGPFVDGEGTRPRILHPGVESVGGATRVALTAGQRLELADFRLPASQAYVQLSGVVFDADGAPAEGARVYLKGAGGNDRIVSEPVVADFMGRFVIAARAGAGYGLFAERARSGGRSSRVDSTDELRLIAVDGLKPVRLTLARRY